MKPISDKEFQITLFIFGVIVLAVALYALRISF